MKTDRLPKSRKTAALKVCPFMGVSISDKKCMLLLCVAISALFLVPGCLAQAEISSGGPSFTLTDGVRTKVSAQLLSRLLLLAFVTYTMLLAVRICLFQKYDSIIALFSHYTLFRHCKSHCEVLFCIEEGFICSAKFNLCHCIR